MGFLQQYLTQFLIGVALLFLVAAGVQTVRLTLSEGRESTAKATLAVKQAQLDSQVSVVKQLAENGETLTMRVGQWQEKAERDAQKNAEAMEALRKERVPLKCEDAVKWAAVKAQALAVGW